jgi:hypothetical protein
MVEKDEPCLAATTVNARLSHVGIIDRWDEAARQRDRETMIALLQPTPLSLSRIHQSNRI